MKPNTLSIPLARMPNVNFLEVAAGMRQMYGIETLYYYIVDSKFRKSVSVRDWYNRWEVSEIGQELVKSLPKFDGTPNDKARKCLRWVQQNVTYARDEGTWGMTEYWALPHETLEKGQGDCEDGMLLLYAVMKHNGFHDDQLYMTCGDVVGGGHAYLVYVSSEDAVHYVLDWCYWPSDSLRIKYGENPNYYFGDKEWFRFNSTSAYVRRR
jgi:hypothetical protein